MPRAAWIAAGVLLAVGIGAIFVPFLTRDRDALTGTPVPPPLGGREHIMPIETGSEVCLDSVAITAETERVRTIVGTYFRPGQPLTLEIEGEGYRVRSRVPAGYADNAPVDFPVTPPDSETLATMCLRNVGRRKVALYATAAEYESARPSVTLDGETTAHEPGFVLLEGDRSSLAERLPDAFRRAALFRPVPAAFLWVLAILVAVAVLVLPFAALASAVRDDERSPDDPTR